MRSYNSASNHKGIFGYGWSSNIEERVEHNSDAQQVEVVSANGATQRFDLMDGQWVDESSDEGVLTQVNGNEWLYIRYDGTEKRYNAAGQIVSIVALNGLSISYAYKNGKLDRLSDDFGNTISLTYQADGFVKSFTDPDDFIFMFDYENENLTEVTYPDTAVKLYHYENSDFPHALTGLTDEEGIRYASWTYDQFGRATSSVHSNDIERFSISFNPDTTVTTTNALGKQTTYYYESIRGLLKVTDVEGHQSTNCAAAFTNTTYDPDTGFADGKTDWRGNKVELEHNIYGQLTSKTIVDSGTDWSETSINERVTVSTDYNALRLPKLITYPNLKEQRTYTPKGRIDLVRKTDMTSHAQPLFDKE